MADLLQATEEFVRKELAHDASGHDWWHIHRVRQLAVRLAKEEGADLQVVELAALLHDIADAKFHHGDVAAGSQVARTWLESQDADPEAVVHVCDIIKTMSWKGTTDAPPMGTTEGKVVQDADRLDAMGAIGVARAFAYGSMKGRPMHDPAIAVAKNAGLRHYHSAQGTTINHFYEKLLLLKDRLNTPAARRLGEDRHKFIEEYVKEFFQEWDGLR